MVVLVALRVTLDLMLETLVVVAAAGVQQAAEAQGKARGVKVFSLQIPTHCQIQAQYMGQHNGG
jgi:hypothetical protein